MRIIFIRHGETRWNSEGKLQGQLDIPLSDIGVNQIKLLPLRLKKEKIDLVFSSSLSRAYNTAKPIANYFDLGIISTTLLSERNFGVLQGVKLKEIDKDEKKKIILKKSGRLSQKKMPLQTPKMALVKLQLLL